MKTEFKALNAVFLACSLVLSQQAMAAEQDNDEKESGDNAEVITVTSSKRGLIAYVSASGLKTDTPIVETPASVSVLTDERIKDLGAETIQDGLGYVSGVFNGPFGVDTRGDWSAIRGVDPEQYLDGMKMLYGYYNNTRPNPYSMSQIEVLKGPSSVLYGQGTTGGIVNLVSKLPEYETFGEVWGQVGNYSRKQVAFDYNSGELNDDGSLLFRVNGLGRESDTQTDFVNDDSLYLSPSLTWFAGDTTKITFLANVQENNSGSSTQFFPHVGTLLPAPNGQIPVERFVSEPGFDRYDTEQQSFTTIIEQELGLDWTLRAAARYMDSESDYRSMYGYPFALQSDDRSILRALYIKQGEATSLTSDIRLHGKFETENTEHNLVIGFDYQDADTQDDTYFELGGGGLFDVYNPTYGSITLPSIDQLPLAAGPEQNTQQQGFYIQDSIKIQDHLIVSGGMRFDEFETTTAGAVVQNDSETTGRLGVMYAFDNGFAPYISYAESFQTIIGADANGEAFKPKSGEQQEIGVKYQPRGTEHLITASTYRITETNRQTQDLNNPGYQVQTGKAKLEGYELEGQFEWDNLDIYASYTKSDSEILESNLPPEVGAELEGLPDQMISTWATYRPQTAWEGFKIGAGFRFVDEVTFYRNIDMVTGDKDEFNTDSYTLFDFMLGYEWDNLDLSLNVDNVTDKTVVTTCLNRGDCFYGQKRTVTANLRYNF